MMEEQKRAVSRETFDGVVKENMEEFGMTKDEAVADAIQQFNAQGVDVTSMATCGDQTLDIAEVMSRLKMAEDNDDLMDQLRQAFEADKASRATAASNGAFQLLSGFLRNNRKHALQAMASLLDGQPDLMDQDTVLLVVEHLTADGTTEDIGAAAAIVAASCFKHEANRLAFVDAGVLAALLNSCEKYPSNVLVVRNACKALRALTRDDDVRVPFGRGIEHANKIVTQHDGLKVLLKVAREFQKEASTLAEVFGTLTRVAVRAEYCDAMAQQGALNVILEALMDHAKDAVLVRQGLGLLKALAGSDEAKVEIVKAGGVEAVLSSMSVLPLAAGVAEVACACIAAFVLRNLMAADRVIAAGGATAIVSAMITHKTHAPLQRHACMAIRNLVSRSKEHAVHFLEANVEEAIQVSRRNHPQVEDEAKAALRDLGCKVVFRELWTGEKGNLA